MEGGYETREERAMRTFETGATRNNDPERVEWVKMLSLPAMFEYAKYMRAHRQQADGNLREYDNWKGMNGRGGFPLNDVVESLMRHTLDLAALDAGVEPMRECDKKEACCAIIFNAMSYLHTILAKEQNPFRRLDGGGGY